MKLEQYLEFDKEIKEKLTVWVNNRFNAKVQNINYHILKDEVSITYTSWTTCFVKMPIEYLSLELEEIASKAIELYKQNNSKESEFVELKRKVENSEDFSQLKKLGQDLGRVPFLSEGLYIKSL